MWWQALPPLGIIGGCLCVQLAGMGLSHYMFTGRPTCRSLTEGTHRDIYIRVGYRRDTYNVGNEYESRGLDYLPDED